MAINSVTASSAKPATARPLPQRALQPWAMTAARASAAMPASSPRCWTKNQIWMTVNPPAASG